MMSKTKNYYHDEICKGQSDPRADRPNPDEEKASESWQEELNNWWRRENDDTEWIESHED
jgi:hypothetical protein